MELKWQDKDPHSWTKFYCFRVYQPKLLFFLNFYYKQSTKLQIAVQKLLQTINGYSVGTTHFLNNNNKDNNDNNNNSINQGINGNIYFE